MGSENGTKNKKISMGANFRKKKERFNLWMAISWECIIVRSSNLQDFHFIGHGSQSQIFREIWEGHHGTSRWFDMEWLMSKQLLVIVHSVNEKKYNWKKTFIPSNITVCIFISNGCCPCIFSDLLHSCEVNVASSEYGQSSQETTSLCLIKLSIMVTFFEPQSGQHKNNKDKVSYNCQYLLQD